MKTTNIQVSKKLRDFLIDNIIKKGESYEDIIWRLMGKNKDGK